MDVGVRAMVGQEVSLRRSIAINRNDVKGSRSLRVPGAFGGDNTHVVWSRHRRFIKIKTAVEDRARTWSP